MNVVEGNLLILASAGSGKTYQLGNRVIGRVAAGVEPEKIVALTFTRKAAGEFADSVLGKLAEAVIDPDKSRRLAADLGHEDADFPAVLQVIIKSLPRFTLTTIDSFFARVVRGFQYELGVTGGRFDLLEGPRAIAESDALLGELLGRALDEGRASEFARAFRRAIAGREGVAVRANLRQFIKEWHRRYRDAESCIWGPDFLFKLKPSEWEEEKHSMAAEALETCKDIIEQRKGQVDQVRKFIDALEAYSLSSGAFPDSGMVAEGILDAIAEGTQGDVDLKFHKPFILPAHTLQAISRLVSCAAAAEMGAAVLRTRAIAHVINGYDSLAEERLRRRGRLGFDEVKRLMGEWRNDEESRLRRERVDFRLDARYEHWLLDEFQDTSREEWNGLLPLLQEAVQDGDVEGSLFVVGDRKQAIYGWRGGDVGLFDEMNNTFGDGIRSIPMAQSWRSCPEVLDLVNRVCGNSKIIESTFGICPNRWVWNVHESAPSLQLPTYAGEARVEYIDLADSGQAHQSSDDSDTITWDPRVTRMIEQMRELKIGQVDLTCGVLVRRNEEARLIADTLRSSGFDVVLDGVRHPASDHPAGTVAWQLLRWMANPDDAFARRILEMSPLAKILRPTDQDPWYDVWERIHKLAQSLGYARMVEELFHPLNAGLSPYGKRRIQEVIEALVAFDLCPDAGALAAANWLERLEVPQNPGAAAVQVMTIHKSKGLGFDVVFLPILPDSRIPEIQRFRVAQGEGWLSEVPPSWARRFFPEIRAAEEKWASDQAYESLCMLYVALTRAKRGLYLYLGKKGKSAKTDSPTLTNWMLHALGSTTAPGVLFQAGNPNWSLSTASRESRSNPPEQPCLGPIVPRRKRLSPSKLDENFHLFPDNHERQFTTGQGDAMIRSDSRSGKAFGIEVHRCFEMIEWLQDLTPGTLPDTKAGQWVAELLLIDEIAEIFTKKSLDVVIHREQMVDAVIDEQWLSGVIDRMHVYRTSPGGEVNRIEIIDFKTDSVESDAELLQRHTTQIQSYGRILATLFPSADIQLLLISTSLRALIPIPMPQK